MASALDGTFVSTAVHGVVDGDRAYFRIWSRSGIVKRLEHAGAVQLTPCSVLGLWSYPPPLDVGRDNCAADRLFAQLAADGFDFG